MKITVQATDLKKYLGIVNRGIGVRPQLPILSGVLLKVTKDEVNLVSTDLEVSFWVKLPAKIDEEGEMIVPAKLFGELVASLPIGNVHLSIEKNILTVSSKGINAEVMGQGVEDYPSIPRAKKTQITLKSGEFRQKMDRVCISAARDDTRPVLTGVLWELEESKTILAATDGYRLTVDKLDVVKTSIEKNTRFILPARSLQEISKVLAETGEDNFGIEFDKENQQVIFTIADMEISSRLIAGDFPPYQQIMPNTYSTKAVFSREGLLEAVKRANLFARDNANIVKMSIEGEKLIVKAESSQLGSNSTEIETEVEGEGLTVAFNARYLLDYLGVNNAERVVWETEGELKPSVFRREDDDGWIQVVMPVRVQN
ncbi:TPA: DNA polymerase III subunit beta [Candidatus Collierbacteria bacterium]|uniref:Beta sliding clamp n=1 Tax=Candidatus Collierbacteria bacterium GW2011_GWB2_44_22 TaxID=1618387 RepID=A0A0G1K4T9_9BACT|nr:MAG: polymerase III subunit beta protein [Candidatus Collierbacteria bacterium GW2011_GWA2_44_13]KKT51292.1 MAG: polymerase III subunit beta protein [Candidatus Collierbacteria bacterium GW2011_GWB2_44_22]KKT61668.1 MAG: polymerase III subunit beta protein [Candidatus Collierbacteria bacterium GW2011_GWD1_44_27]KKT68926.1 MAG: polymerase III subunit beta protein [Microgenomates group bacterium GW2011_GWC1_44_37]KKT87747.1 MAG: polymerase III subunit beta protein [Candidatus Collierbacteria b